MLKFLWAMLASCSGFTPTQLPEDHFAPYETGPALTVRESLFCGAPQDCPGGACAPQGKVQVCLFPNSPNGAFCQHSGHCRSGLCLDRGDGPWVCMGEGQRGDFCRSDEHCRRGKCRPLATQLAVCL